MGKPIWGDLSLSILHSLWSKALYTALFVAFVPLSRSCTSSWSIVESVQTSIWLSYVYGISVGMKYISFKVFGYDILRHLITKATFHISSIRHWVVMINMRSRKAGNGLKDGNSEKDVCPFDFPIWEFVSQKKRLCHYFLKQLQLFDRADKRISHIQNLSGGYDLNLDNTSV
jgi:hypothetical protein